MIAGRITVDDDIDISGHVQHAMMAAEEILIQSAYTADRIWARRYGEEI